MVTSTTAGGPLILLLALAPLSCASPTGSGTTRGAILAATRICEPFAAKLAEHLELQPDTGSVPSLGVLQGRQALVFGAGSSVVKYVGRQHTERKSAPKQRVFVDSLRREVNFYRSLQQEGAERPSVASLFPRVSLALATSRDADCAECEAFCLVMDDLGQRSLPQAAALLEASAAAVLAALATLHAHHWGDATVLAAERGGYWGLERRPSSELDIDAAQRQWSSVVSAFAGQARALPPTLGRDLASSARRLDLAVQATAATMIHGDPKPFNAFLVKGDDGKLSAKLIDMSWCGKGNPLSDVAYVLAAALDVSLLHSGGARTGSAAGDDDTPERGAPPDDCAAGSVEEDDAAAESVLQRLLAGYQRSLLAQLSDEFQTDYLVRIRPSFEWCFLDYSRIVVLRLWKTATPAAMAENADKHGPSMVNRSPRHLEWIARRADRVLTQLSDQLNTLTPPGNTTVKPGHDNVNVRQQGRQPPRVDYKMLYLIRHGEAGHNALFADANAAAAAGDTTAGHELKALGYDVHDGVLTAQGEASAKHLGLVLNATLAATSDDLLLVSSPMRRALQTAQLAFQSLTAAGKTSASGSDPMRVTVLVVPLHRERDGGLGRRCDSGTVRSELELQFSSETEYSSVPGTTVAFDFGHLSEHWCLRHEQLLARAGRDIGPTTAAMVAIGEHNAWRESEAALDERIHEFAAWLESQPQRAIAVVGHGDFWQAFTGRVFGRAVRLPNCGWVSFEGPMGVGAVMTLGPGATVTKG